MGAGGRGVGVWGGDLLGAEEEANESLAHEAGPCCPWAALLSAKLRRAGGGADPATDPRQTVSHTFQTVSIDTPIHTDKAAIHMTHVTSLPGARCLQHGRHRSGPLIHQLMENVTDHLLQIRTEV